MHIQCPLLSYIFCSISLWKREHSKNEAQISTTYQKSRNENTDCSLYNFASPLNREESWQSSHDIYTQLWWYRNHPPMHSPCPQQTPGLNAWIFSLRIRLANWAWWLMSIIAAIRRLMASSRPVWATQNDHVPKKIWNQDQTKTKTRK
jgi:hypothetical protein